MSDGDETPDDETPETESADGEGERPEEPTENESESDGADEGAVEDADTETTGDGADESASAEGTETDAEGESGDADAEEASESDAAEEASQPESEADAGAEDESDDADAEADSEDESEGDGDAAEPESESESESEGDGDESRPEDEAMETTVTEEELDERLDGVEADLEAAETESDLDAVEAELDAIEADLEGADLPEPEGEAGEDGEDADEEDAVDPREEIQGRIDTLRDAIESQRGPYAEDVVSTVEDAKSRITDTRWTEQGEHEVAEAVRPFTAEVSELLDGDFEPVGDDEDALTDALDEVSAAVEAADLDPDDDAETVEALVEAADGLESDLDDAQAWDDLETREKLVAQGYYDCLGHYKDFPPEWAALKEWEKRDNVEMVLLALDSFQSDFMEEHALEALTRMNDSEAFEPMHQRAQKRDKPAVRALGKMQAEDAVETLVEYVDADSDPALQKVTFKALGEIGDETATQALANKLDADGEVDDTVRPHAARALGILGDTRAVDPLADTLANDADENVRAAAAWALRQIGTRRALEAAAEYADERSYIVQHEAEKARDDLDVATPA